MNGRGELTLPWAIIVAMLLDIGAGIIWGILFDSLSDAHSLGVFVWFGIFSALSPDMDFLYHLATGGTMRDDHRHREVFHKPLFLAIGWLVVALVATPTLAWLFVVGALGHFVHDSIGIGWGVQWLAPFNNDHFTFLYRVHTADKPAPPKRRLYVWPNAEIDDLNKRYGDEDWFKNTYLRWHPFAIVELAVLVAALAALWVYAG